MRASPWLKRAAVLTVAVAVVPVAGCRTSSGENGAGTTGTSAPTDTGARPTTAPPTGSTAPRATCTAGAPAGAPTGAGRTADVDGDGRADTATVYAAGGGPWTLVVDLAGRGRASTLVTTGGTETGTVAVIGAADADDDGADELFLRVGSAAAAEIVSIYDLVGCDLGVYGAHQPWFFAIGASATTSSGLRCTPDATGTVEQYEATRRGDDPSTIDVTIQPLRLRASDVTPAGPSTTRVIHEGEAAPELSHLVCGSLQWP